jgi:hypothetical protein
VKISVKTFQNIQVEFDFSYKTTFQTSLIIHKVIGKSCQPSQVPGLLVSASLIILGGNRQGLQVDRDKAVLFGDWGEARSEKA